MITRDGFVIDMNNDERPKLDLTDIPSRSPETNSMSAGRPFLSVHFNCCRVYQRVYASPDGKRYEGRCPKCLRTIRFVVGQGGTTDRSFVVE